MTPKKIQKQVEKYHCMFYQMMNMLYWYPKKEIWEVAEQWSYDS